MPAIQVIPQDIRTRGDYVEVDNSGARGAVVSKRAVLWGQRSADGQVAEGELTPVLSVSDAKAWFGEGSMLALMAEAYILGDPGGELWAVPLDDPDGGTAAVRTLTFAGSADEDGTLALYVHGRVIRIAIAEGDTQDEQAAAVEAALDEVSDLPFASWTATDNTVALVALNKGTIGNLIDVRFNARGRAADEQLPAGVSVSVTLTTPGVGVPSLTPAIAAISGERFTYCAHPYSDAAELATIEAAYANRWNYEYQDYGHVVTARVGDKGTLATYGEGLNGPETSVVALEGSDGNTPSGSHWVPMVAAAVLAAVAVRTRNLATRPVDGAKVVGIMAAPVGERWTRKDRDALMKAGLTPLIGIGSGLVLEDMVTLYQVDESDAEDASFRSINTRLALEDMAVEAPIRVRQTYPGHVLVPDGTKVNSGVPAVAPAEIEGTISGLYSEWVGRGLAVDAVGFNKTLDADINPSNNRMVDIFLEPRIPGGYVISRWRIRFAL